MEHIDLVVEEYFSTRGIERVQIDLDIRYVCVKYPWHNNPQFWTVIKGHTVWREQLGYPLHIYRDYYELEE